MSAIRSTSAQELVNPRGKVAQLAKFDFFWHSHCLVLDWMHGASICSWISQGAYQAVPVGMAGVEV